MKTIVIFLQHVQRMKTSAQQMSEKTFHLMICNDQICLPVVAIDQGIEQHRSCHVTRVESLQMSMMINVRP